MLKFTDERFALNQFLYFNNMMTYLAIICVNGLHRHLQKQQGEVQFHDPLWVHAGLKQTEAEIIERKETTLSDSPFVSHSIPPP